VVAALNLWHEQLQPALPAHALWPSLSLSRRRFPALPLDLEQAIVRLEVLEDCLANHEQQRRG
jgi:hypothetical protein